MHLCCVGVCKCVCFVDFRERVRLRTEAQSVLPGGMKVLDVDFGVAMLGVLLGPPVCFECVCVCVCVCVCCSSEFSFFFMIGKTYMMRPFFPLTPAISISWTWKRRMIVQRRPRINVMFPSKIERFPIPTSLTLELRNFKAVERFSNIWMLFLGFLVHPRFPTFSPEMTSQSVHRATPSLNPCCWCCCWCIYVIFFFDLILLFSFVWCILERSLSRKKKKMFGTYGIQIVDLHSGTTKLDVTPLEKSSLLNGLVLFLKTWHSSCCCCLNVVFVLFVSLSWQRKKSFFFGELGENGCVNLQICGDVKKRIL